MRLAVLALCLAGCTARPVDDGRVCASEADCARIHPPGIADPSSPDFHAQLVVRENYHLEKCQQCHGADFSGGTSGRTCLTCHQQGPTACNTCHGQPPATGAHQAHGTRYDCTECHVKPAAYTDVGHIFDVKGNVMTTAQVIFGAKAGPLATFDGTRCSNVTCHGPATPAWNGGPDEAKCGSCHGDPPASHAGRKADCSACHPTDAMGNGAKHVNGVVDVGDDSGTCQACHPTPGGAHTAHTQATHELAPKLGCGECHQTFTNVDDPGHIDHPDPIVFPPGTSALARTGGANPTWDAASLTCSGVYCHLAKPQNWNGTQIICGSCHGIPPSDSAHLPSFQLTDCHNCHRTVDATGALKPATHINGIVDGP
jgi:predicted CxxxxCH...CXXCH cytochrome family protein